MINMNAFSTLVRRHESPGCEKWEKIFSEMNFVRSETLFTEVTADGKYVERVRRVQEAGDTKNDDRGGSKSELSLKPNGISSEPARGMSIEGLASELAPPKNLNTDDYEYLVHLEEKKRKNELLRKIELEKELKDFQRIRNSRSELDSTLDSKPKSLLKPSISKDISKLIKVKPKTGTV